MPTCATVAPCPEPQGEKVLLEHSLPGQTSVPLLHFPFASSFCLALGNWELGCLPTSKSYQSPKNKRLSPHRSRGHRCPRNTSLGALSSPMALQGRQWEWLQAAPCALDGAGPALGKARGQAAEGVLTEPSLSFEILHETQPSFYSPRGPVSDQHGACL